MKALVLEGPRQAVIKDVEYPKPGPRDVIIKVERTGICGTDFHIYQGSYMSNYPLIPGHEFSGTVFELGENIDSFAVGDRVTADPNIFCGRCVFCLTRRGNQCVKFEANGVTINGSMAEYVRVPVHNVVKLPDTMSFAEGAFVEPVACVVQAMNRLQLQIGNRVILFGAGSMGQQLVQAIARSGASQLCVVDISEIKLKLAMQHGATHSVLSGELARNSIEHIAPYGFDVVIDATGISSVIEQAFSYMGPAAKYLQFGVAHSDAFVKINPFQLFKNDWTLLGSMAVNYSFIPALQWISAGRIIVEPLLSDIITLEEAAQYLANPGNPHHLKIQIQP